MFVFHLHFVYDIDLRFVFIILLHHDKFHVWNMKNGTIAEESCNEKI